MSLRFGFVSSTDSDGRSEDESSHSSLSTGIGARGIPPPPSPFSLNTINMGYAQQMVSC